MPTPPSPRAARPTLGRWISAELVRYVAFTQSGMLVGLHFGWIAMLIAGTTMLDDANDGREHAGRLFFVTVRWLGGIDANGHGDIDSMLGMWGKVSLVLFLPRLLLDLFGGERKPWPFRRKLAWSTALIAAGYLVGFGLFALHSEDGGDIGETAWVWAMFVAFGLASGAWAFGAGMLGETIARALLTPAPSPPLFQPTTHAPRRVP